MQNNNYQLNYNKHPVASLFSKQKHPIHYGSERHDIETSNHLLSHERGSKQASELISAAKRAIEASRA